MTRTKETKETKETKAKQAKTKAKDKTPSKSRLTKISGDCCLDLALVESIEIHFREDWHDSNDTDREPGDMDFEDMSMFIGVTVKEGEYEITQEYWPNAAKVLGLQEEWPREYQLDCLTRHAEIENSRKEEGAR